jgi:hypothetical protein
MLKPSKETDMLSLAIKRWNGDISCEQIDTTIEEYLRRVSFARQSLHSMSLVFSGSQTVLPVHCNKAISALEEIGELIQEFCEFLRPTLSVSRLSSAPHYRLVCTLHTIKKCTDNLSDLINSYIPSYKQPRSPFAGKQRRYISHSFELLSQYMADLCLQAEQPGEEEEAPDQKIFSAALLYMANYQDKCAQVER